MKSFSISLSILVLFFTSSVVIGMQGEWSQIKLPNVFIVPETNKLDVDGRALSVRKGVHEYRTDAQSYRLSMPASSSYPNGLQWFADTKSCREKLGTVGKYPKAQQTVLRSDHINSISGLSFKGRLVNPDVARGSEKNHYAIFFHEDECYKGGIEYGFVFYEDMESALFYICENCNLIEESYLKEEKQIWWNWPNILERKKNGKSIAVTDLALDYGWVRDSLANREALVKALGNPSRDCYWNIIIQPDDSFLIEVIDANNMGAPVASCKIAKPSFVKAKLYKAPGYITLNVKRDKNLAEEKKLDAETGYIQVDEVRIRP